MTRGTPWQATFLIVMILPGIATTPAVAFNPHPEPPGSSAIGLGSDQTAIIRVVNDTDRFSGILPCVCPVLLTLLDDSGAVLGSFETEVEPGHIGFHEFDLALRSSDRRIVRARVEFSGSEGARLACNAATRSSLEIAETSSGRATAVLPIVTTYLPVGGE